MKQAASGVRLVILAVKFWAIACKKVFHFTKIIWKQSAQSTGTNTLNVK
jgi:hypothetical protein